MFSNKDLRNLIVPFFLEQLLMALAVYNAGAALYRSFGKTSTTMYLSIASNIINVVGNCIGVFWLHAGVAGVAWPSLLARMFSAVVITFFCFSEKIRCAMGKHGSSGWMEACRKSSCASPFPTASRAAFSSW